MTLHFWQVSSGRLAWPYRVAPVYSLQSARHSLAGGRSQVAAISEHMPILAWEHKHYSQPCSDRFKHMQNQAVYSRDMYRLAGRTVAGQQHVHVLAVVAQQSAQQHITKQYVPRQPLNIVDGALTANSTQANITTCRSECLQKPMQVGRDR